MFKFRWRYFILTLVLLLVEILIAMFVHDAIIRPHIGDLLVVVVIYCFIRSFLQCSVVSTAIAVLLFAYLVEVLQYFHLIDRLNLQRSKFAVLMLGNAFSWIDMLAYTLGIAVVLLAEKHFKND